MILERVKKSIEPDLKITEKSTPVPYFGQYENAKACTISLNPSDREFCDKDGNILDSSKERLCSRVKLNCSDNIALSDTEAKEVIKYCDNYFQLRPYKIWFNKYEKLLNYFDYSYYDGSVTHLDLVQWATTPFWRELPKDVKEKLLHLDLPFLHFLLKKDFECIFLNGVTTVTEVSNHLSLNLDEIEICLIGDKKAKVFLGWYNNSRVIGWSPYLQSASVGGYENIEKVARLIFDENKKHITSC